MYVEEKNPMSLSALLQYYPEASAGTQSVHSQYTVHSRYTVGTQYTAGTQPVHSWYTVGTQVLGSSISRTLHTSSREKYNI